MPDNKPAAYGKNAVGRPRTKGRAKALKTDNDPRLLAARVRHASRDASNSMRYANPEIVEAGVGSALRGLIKLATRSKYPKFAPKKASLEDKIKYRETRAKELKAARDKRNAKVQARKDKRIAKWRAKQDKKPAWAKPKSTKPSYMRDREETIAANKAYRDRAARIHEQKYQDARAKAAKDAEAVERIRFRAMQDRKPKGSGTPRGYRRGY